MVIGNGFITYSINDAKQEIVELCKGKDIRIAPLPTTDSMTYFISNKGEVYGCQKMKNMYLTKPKKVEMRYSLGAGFRYVVPKGEKYVYMQQIMYCTFVLGYWKDGLELEPIDGNVYNYQIENIKLKTKIYTTLKSNLEYLKNEYKSHFLDVAWYAKYIANLKFDDCKDIASNAFYELCEHNFNYDNDLFVGLWKKKVYERTLDFLKYQSRFQDCFNDDGEEILHSKVVKKDIVDWEHLVNGTQRKKCFKQWLNGDTPTQIADDNNIGRATVASYLTRIIQTLQEEYKKDILIYNS